MAPFPAAKRPLGAVPMIWCGCPLVALQLLHIRKLGHLPVFSTSVPRLATCPPSSLYTASPGDVNQYPSAMRLMHRISYVASLRLRLAACNHHGGRVASRGTLAGKTGRLPSFLICESCRPTRGHQHYIIGAAPNGCLAAGTGANCDAQSKHV